MRREKRDPPSGVRSIAEVPEEWDACGHPGVRKAIITQNLPHLMIPSLPPISYTKPGNGPPSNLPDCPLVSGSKESGAWLEYEKTDTGFIIRNDPAGLRTIFYHENGEKLHLNPDSAVLARELGLRWNWSATGNSWLLVNQIGYDAPFEGMKKLAPGSTLTVDRGRIRVEETPWKPASTDGRTAIGRMNSRNPDSQATGRPGIQEKTDASRKENITAESWAETVLQTIETFRNGRPVSLGLSGGLDSRVLLALLTNSGIPFRTHVYGLPDAPDVRVSTSISGKMGPGHRHYEPILPPVEELAEAACRHASATMATRPASDVLNLGMFSDIGESGSVLVDGGFGEIGRRQYLKRLWYLARWALYRNDIQSITKHLTAPKPAIFAPEIAAKMKEGLKETVEREWMRVRNMGLDMPATLDLFALRHRVPNFGAPIQAVMDQMLPNIMPLIHPEVLEASFAMPARQKAGSRLFRNTIAQYAPALQDFPLAKGETVVPYHQGFWRTQIEEHLRKIRSSRRFRRTEQSGVTSNTSNMRNTGNTGNGSNTSNTRNGSTTINTGNTGEKELSASIPVLFLKHIEPWLRDHAGSREVRECGIYDMAALQMRLDAFFAGDITQAAWLDWWLAFEGFRMRSC